MFNTLINDLREKIQFHTESMNKAYRAIDSVSRTDLCEVDGLLQIARSHELLVEHYQAQLDTLV